MGAIEWSNGTVGDAARGDRAFDSGSGVVLRGIRTATAHPRHYLVERQLRLTLGTVRATGLGGGTTTLGVPIAVYSHRGATGYRKGDQSRRHDRRQHGSRH